MSLPRPEHYNGFVIDYTIVDYANGIIQWQIENEDGEVMKEAVEKYKACHDAMCAGV